MQVLGARASATLGAEPDIAAWMNRCALNPSRILDPQLDDPALEAARARLAEASGPGLARLAELAVQT